MAMFNSYVKSPEGVYIYILVGGIPTPLKNMKVSWNYYSQLNGKIKNVPNLNHQIYNIYKSLQKTCVSASYNPPFMAKNDQSNFPNHLVCPVSPGLWGDKCG